MDELSERFDETCQAAGVRDSTGGLPVMPGGLDMEEEEDEIAGDVVMVEQLDDHVVRRRKEVSMAKRKRMSLWARASQEASSLLPPASSFFSKRQSTKPAASCLAENEEISMLRHEYTGSFPIRESSLCEVDSVSEVSDEKVKQVVMDDTLLVNIFSFLTESEMLCRASLVCTTWASAVTMAHASHMMASVGYHQDIHEDENEEEEVPMTDKEGSRVMSTDRDWRYLTRMFPWACFLSSGAFKRVFKVHNLAVGAEEAVSVMDVDAIEDKKVIAAELVVSSMLSALARRGICPNFVVLHGVFTLPYDVPKSHWGCETVKRPKGSRFIQGKKMGRPPRQPKDEFSPGRYQCMRMELCSEGDFEEYLKRQQGGRLSNEMARASLFQIAFALHAAAERCSLKHYDMKLLNVFVQDISHSVDAAQSQVVLRYGLGSHVFALRLPSTHAFFAKLADYGTANIQNESTGMSVTIAQYTTIENTPPDYMILGDDATQGHGHDNFGLGLCMLHLFTGHAPYEEIMEDIICPPMLKRKLRNIWENENRTKYSVIRSVILTDVYKDERGHIVEGEPDETLYDTLYRFLVLFGLPEEKFEQRKCPAVWKAISDALECKRSGGRRPKQGTDIAQFDKDRQKYSIHYGTNVYIARARHSLEAMEGGMELLCQLCSFDPSARATALQVLNSRFMEPLREPEGSNYEYEDSLVFSYNAFSTFTPS